MSDTVSDYLPQRINAWGIKRIYDFLGEDINEIIGVVGRTGDNIDYIQVRHEEMTASKAHASTPHLHVACTLPALRHAKLFYDHARIERLLLNGFTEPRDGAIHPDLSRPGIGVEFNHSDAKPYPIPL